MAKKIHEIVIEGSFKYIFKAEDNNTWLNEEARRKTALVALLNIKIEANNRGPGRLHLNDGRITKG